MRSGKVAIVTAAMRQLRQKAITIAITMSDRFCTVVGNFAANAFLSSGALTANFHVNAWVLFSSISNQLTSLSRIAETRSRKE